MRRDDRSRRSNANLQADFSVYGTLCLVSTAVLGTTVVDPPAPTTCTGAAAIGADALGRVYPERSSHLPNIIFPAVVCSTDVTDTSIVLPIIFRALSTTTMVPSSR